MSTARWGAALLGALLVGVMMIAATGSLDHLFSDRWLAGVAFPSVVGLAGAFVARGLGGRVWLPALTGAVAGTVTAVRTWWEETLAGGWIPTRETAEALIWDTQATLHTIRVDQAPIEPLLHVLSVLSLVVLLIVLVVDMVAIGLRSPAVAGLPALGVIAAGSVLSGDITPLPALLLAGVAWLALLVVGDHPSLQGSVPSTTPGGRHVATSDPLGPLPPKAALPERLGSTTGALMAGGAAILVLALSATQIAPITTGLAPEGHRFLIRDGSTPVDPASDLGATLRQGEGAVGIHYRSSTGRGVYLRTAVIHDVTAARWTPVDPGPGVAPNGNVFAPVGQALRQGATSSGLERSAELEEALERPAEEQVELSLSGYTGTWLPVADQPVGQNDVPKDQGWMSDGRTATVYRESSEGADLDYTSRYWTIPLDADQMAALVGYTGLPDPGSYTGLEAPGQTAVGTLVADPELEGTQIQELAQQVLSETEVRSPVDVGTALQEHFQAGDYAYSETAPVDEGYDGTGIEITEQFLEAQSGYCIHYASAMALMARSVGVPARIVVGYAPVGADGDGVHRVQAQSAHAWPELYVMGVGWMPFEPTPTVGRAPEYTQSASSGPAPEEDPTAQAPSATPSQEPTFEATPPPSPTASGSGGSDGPDLRTVLTVLGVVLGLLLLALVVLAPHLLRSRRRRRRLGATGRAEDGVRRQVLEVWREVEDTATDLGLGREASESEDAFAARIRRSVGSALTGGEDSLRSLAGAAQWARYGAPSSTPQEGALRAPVHGAAVVQMLEQSVEPGVRRRAWWLPLSVIRTMRYR